MEFEKIKEIIAELLNIPAARITMETSFTKDLGADSLDLFQIISEMEDEFDLEFSSDAADKIKTVADAVEYIKSKTE
jgi:acyl carrier protein